MNKLIYGKNNIERIVSIEPKEDIIEIFIEDKEGNVCSQIQKNAYWILSNKQIDNKFVCLKGDLYYKYGRQFKNKKDFYIAKKAYQEHDIFSISDSKEAIMVKDGYTYFKGMKYDEVSTLSFDIETTGLTHDTNSKVLIISNTFRKNGKIIRKLFGINDYNSQAEMLYAWINWVKEINPSLLIGHNINGFDFPYINYVCNMEGIDFSIGRDGSNIKINTNYEATFRVDGNRDLHYHKVYCYGREIIDTMFLAYRYDIGKKYESYALKPIIKTEGLEASDRVFYDASKIKDNYKNLEEWEKIKAYAMFDADDALKLYDLFAPAFFYMTQSIPKSFQSVTESASGSQINSIMIRSYLQEARSLPKQSEEIKYQGAISFGNPGIYRNVFKIDVASLYPSIMIQHKVHDPEKDPNRNFLQLVETFTSLRLEYKKKAKENKYCDDLQASYKIFINSCYGFLGTGGLLFNSPSNAEFVTKTGREVLQKALDWAEQRNFKIVNADTDSISFVKNNEDPMTDIERNELLKSVNSLYPEKIRFEDDGYYHTVIVMKAKNYVLYDGKNIKIKGSALKATGKEKALKEFIREIINTILNHKTNYTEIYHKYVKEANDIKDINRWASRKTISEKTKLSKRTNETKIMDAIEGTSYAEGDRVYVYFKDDESLGLVENFDGSYNKSKMIKKVFETSRTFSDILPVKDLFINYSLQKNINKVKNL